MNVTDGSTIALKKGPTSSGNWLTTLRDFISFSAEVRRLVDDLNREMEAPERLSFRLASHPMGFVREVAKRRLTIAEAYLKLVSFTKTEDQRERLDALGMLVHQAWHAKTLSMPINTARVQISLMKECVKHRDNRRRQLEWMSDFALASHGQPTVIRRLLKELTLIEVPEEGRPLRQMDLGWDDHVHDFHTEGRKTPSQLILDAFIKGMSRLTVVYRAMSDASLFEEVIRAGEILGIDVQVGWEFSIGEKFNRIHFMYLPPQDGTVSRLNAFLAEHATELEPFFAGLSENAKRRTAALGELLNDFNQVELRELNTRFFGQSYLQVPALRWDDLVESAPFGQVSRIHLGQLLWKTIMPIQHKRVLYLKNQYRLAGDRERLGEVSSWEVEQRRIQYFQAREEYEGLTPEGLVSRFLTSHQRTDFDSVFRTPDEVLPALDDVGGQVVFTHPLTRGVETAVGTLIANHQWVNAIETFNTAIAVHRDPADIRRLNRLVYLLNHNQVEEIRQLFEDWDITGPSAEDLAAAGRKYSNEPLVTRCGSDSIGQASRVPGMGFVRSTRLSKRCLKTLHRRQCPTLAKPIVQLLLEQRQQESAGNKGEIFVLGSTNPPAPNRVGDEGEVERIGLLRFWRYLNLNLKSLIKIGVGFVPTYLVLGLGFALVWFLITGVRNVLVDQVSAAGFSVRNWRIKNVDRNNLANSLFWTGFSVPVLGLAKHGFDVVWPLIQGPAGFLNALVKFWVIAFANGLYIAGHNRLRGFDRQVIRGNFFRSVLSWPLATVGSYLLDLLFIPAIVQVKFWSDVVAGLIEGTGKLIKRLRLAQQYLLEILLSLLRRERLTRQVAMTDILFIWARRQQGKKALRRVLDGRFRGISEAQSEGEVGGTVIGEAREALVDGFQAEGSLEDLTGLILDHYSGREAAKLTDLLATHHLRFARWLDRYRGDGTR